MAASAPWWKGINGEMLANIGGKIHPGALRYYTEAKMAVSNQLRCPAPFVLSRPVPQPDKEPADTGSLLSLPLPSSMLPTPSDKPSRVDRIWPLLDLISIAFHLWLVFSGLVPNLIGRPVHLMRAVPWVLMAPGRSKMLTASGWLLGASGLAAAAWIAFRAG